MMDNEVIEFANEIGSSDLKEIFEDTEYRSLFKRRNYFLLNDDIFLVIKISRNNTRPFWGFGEEFIELLNKLTKNKGTYYFVALESSTSGWFFSKKDILDSISDRSLSYSPEQKQYKINNYNLRHQKRFTSPQGFLSLIGVQANRASL
jgi:hypothetical protein